MEQDIILTSLRINELEILIENSVRKILKESPLRQDNEKTNEPDLLGIVEASTLLKLAIPTIYGLVSNSIIPHMKQGKKLYFSKQELITWIKQGKRKTILERENEISTRLKKSKKSK